MSDSDGVSAADSPGGLSFRDLILALWNGRISILSMALGAGSLALLLSFLIPPSYQAVTTAIPTSPPDRMPALGQLSVNLEDLGIQAGPKSGSSPVIYPEIVRSRRLLEQVLGSTYSSDRTGKPIPLIDVIQPRGQGRKRLEIAVKRIRRLVDASLDRRSGILTVRTRAPSPEIAAGMANSLDTLLQGFIVHSFTSQAGENRRFIEGRLTDTQSDLTSAEERLREFRERNLRIGNSPRLLLEEGRLMRAQREQEEVYLTLRRQYELSKIEEHRDLPVLNILDPAVIPAFRSSPRRWSMAAMGMFLGGLAGVGVALFRYSAHR